MKVSIDFLLLFGYLAFQIVTGSDEKPGAGSVVSADDFPYMVPYMIDMVPESWKVIVVKLSILNNVDLEKLVKKHHHLLLGDEMDGFLRAMLVQHCITFHLKGRFRKGEIDLMKEAIKTGLLTSESRIKSRKSSDSNAKETANYRPMETIFEDIESRLQARVNDKSLVLKMLERAKYVIRACVFECVAISLSNLKVASFLSELFTLMDKGLPHDESYYISKIVTLEQVDELQIEKKVDSKATDDAEDLMAELVRNRQSTFEHLLITNHCVRKLMIDELSKNTPKAKSMVKEAIEYKLEHFSSWLKLFIGDPFQYPEVDSTSIESKALITVANLRADPIFSLVRVSDDYRAIKTKIEIDSLDLIIGSWMAEEILVSTISNDGMYRSLSDILLNIDNETKYSKMFVNVVLASERSWKMDGDMKQFTEDRTNLMEKVFVVPE